jgi:cytochrome P450
MPQPEAGAAAGRRSEGDAEMQLSEVELFDPDVWVDGVPREAFAVLRREAPVFFHEEPGGPGFWVLSRYEDVRHVSKHPEIFSSAAGGTNIPTLDEDALGRMRAIMLNMDPPQHRQFRGIVNKAFTPRMVGSWFRGWRPWRSASSTAWRRRGSAISWTRWQRRCPWR